MSYAYGLRSLVSLAFGSVVLGLGGCAAPVEGGGDVGEWDTGEEEVGSHEGAVSESPNHQRIVTNGLPASILVQHRPELLDLGTRELTPSSVAASPLIHTDDGRELLGYVVKCALGWSETLEVPYFGKVLVFEGGIGLGAKWTGDPLSTTDQRWVSACLLAHANAYGVEVPLSLRGHHPALATTSIELDKYPVEEGSFYGNLFNAADAQAPMYACPGLAWKSACEVSSNDWLEMRACTKGAASTSACGFYVPGDCYDWKAGLPSACGTSDASGYSDCHPTAMTTKAPLGYAEVITVYLMEDAASPCGAK